MSLAPPESGLMPMARIHRTATTQTTRRTQPSLVSSRLTCKAGRIDRMTPRRSQADRLRSDRRQGVGLGSRRRLYSPPGKPSHTLVFLCGGPYVWCCQNATGSQRLEYRVQRLELSVKVPVPG